MQWMLVCECVCQSCKNHRHWLSHHNSLYQGCEEDFNKSDQKVFLKQLTNPTMWSSKFFLPSIPMNVFPFMMFFIFFTSCLLKTFRIIYWSALARVWNWSWLYSLLLLVALVSFVPLVRHQTSTSGAWSAENVMIVFVCCPACVYACTHLLPVSIYMCTLEETGPPGIWYTIPLRKRARVGHQITPQ